MNQQAGETSASGAFLGPWARALLLASPVCLLLAGGLLWWRDGDRLFTDGLISAIARCF
jgi:hypothetical protein